MNGNVIGDKKRSEITAELSAKALKKLRRDFNLVASEVWVDEAHRVDFVAYRRWFGYANAAAERGKFCFVEVKSCMDDFTSGHGRTFEGDENWLVRPRELADALRAISGSFRGIARCFAPTLQETCASPTTPASSGEASGSSRPRRCCSKWCWTAPSRGARRVRFSTAREARNDD